MNGLLSSAICWFFFPSDNGLHTEHLNGFSPVLRLQLTTQTRLFPKRLTQFPPEAARCYVGIWEKGRLCCHPKLEETKTRQQGIFLKNLVGRGKFSVQRSGWGAASLVVVSRIPCPFLHSPPPSWVGSSPVTAVASSHTTDIKNRYVSAGSRPGYSPLQPLPSQLSSSSRNLANWGLTQWFQWWVYSNTSEVVFTKKYQTSKKHLQLKKIGTNTLNFKKK